MADPQYGCEVLPAETVQDMTTIDTIAGAVHDRDAAPNAFTGGSTGAGLGGSAEGTEPAKAARP